MAVDFTDHTDHQREALPNATSILLVIYLEKDVAGQRLSREEREAIATRRIVANLEALTVANMRTLEMKIADAGPAHLRVNPHIITAVRNSMIKRGAIIKTDNFWYHRANADRAAVADRLAVLVPLHRRTSERAFTLRMGQTLEISILKSLPQSGMNFVGGFTDLHLHDDSSNYKKEEPPLSFSGRTMPGDMRFDFLAFHPSAGPIGIEAKNIREWVYPNRSEVKELLHKAVYADTLPVLVARRIPYVTFMLLNTCGVMVFENLNQQYPFSDADLAEAVRKKEDLGYHDVRAGNEPNPRLLHFLATVVPARAEEYRARFERYRDLLGSFADGDMGYPTFAAMVRRRAAGEPEEADWVHDDIGSEAHPDDYEP